MPIGKLIGYAHSHTQDGLDDQVKVLKAAGCLDVFQDMGGANLSPGLAGLNAAVGNLRTGDTLVVRSVSDLSPDRESAMIFIGLLQRGGLQFHALDSTGAEALDIRRDALAATHNARVQSQSRSRETK